VAASLDPEQGTAIITEGLMNYLAPDDARAVWQRIARTLRRFPQGHYLCDAYLREEQRNLAMAAFGAVLQVFVRGRMHVHFRTAADAQQAMNRAAFGDSALIGTRNIPQARERAAVRGGDRVRILHARTGR